MVKNIIRSPLLDKQQVYSRETKQITASAFGLVALMIVAVVLFCYGVYAKYKSAGIIALEGVGTESILIGLAVVVGIFYFWRHR